MLEWAWEITMPPLEQRRKKFYLDFGINPAYIGSLLTTIMVALGWANTVDKTTTKQGEKITAVEKTVEDNERRNREDTKEIRDGIRQILEQGQKERHK